MRLRVKGKQHNPSDFLSVFVCPCWLLLAVEIKAFCMSTQEKYLPREHRTCTAEQDPVGTLVISYLNWLRITGKSWSEYSVLLCQDLVCTWPLTFVHSEYTASMHEWCLFAWKIKTELLTKDFFSHYCSCKHDKGMWPVCLKYPYDAEFQRVVPIIIKWKKRNLMTMSMCVCSYSQPGANFVLLTSTDGKKSSKFFH